MIFLFKTHSRFSKTWSPSGDHCNIRHCCYQLFQWIVQCCSESFIMQTTFFSYFCIYLASSLFVSPITTSWVLKCHLLYVDRGSPSLAWNLLDLDKITTASIKLHLTFKLHLGGVKTCFDFFFSAWQQIKTSYISPISSSSFFFSLSSFSIIPDYGKGVPGSAIGKALEWAHIKLSTWTQTPLMVYLLLP